MINLYIYPNNLKAKPTMWLWQLRDLCIIGIGGILSIVALVQLRIFPPLVLTAVFAFLSIRFEDGSILDFIAYACRYFIGGQQTFHWRAERDKNK